MEFEYIMGMAGGLIIAIVAGYFITNWYHKINKRVQVLEAQYYILTKIAERLEVDKSEIVKANNHASGYQAIDFN